MKIRTWRCGEVGVEGTRLVLPGGQFTIGGKLAGGGMHKRVYEDKLLIPYVDEIIYFHDFDDRTGRLAVHACSFEQVKRRVLGTNEFKFKDHLMVGKFICYASEKT